VTRVLVLGVTGMLGATVGRALSPGLDVVGTARGEPPADAGYPVERFDARTDDPRALVEAVGPDWILNAIGVTKPHIDPGSAESVANALDVNARFPFALAEAAGQRAARVIQIATDGVFAGQAGGYREDAPHDALDVYGKSKSLGEVPAANVTHLRCSIVGPEPPGGRSLVAWLLAQPAAARVPGYSDHIWNGITTWHFGMLCAGIVREQLDLPSPLHVVPSGTVTKAELLELIARAFGREDLVIEAQRSQAASDRSLRTLHPDANSALWRAAGYDSAPTVAAMVDELRRQMI
jgi:dTDP-4-dehydrorhamnose reductase